MAETDRIKKLHSYVDELGSIIKKLDQHAKSKIAESNMADKEDVISETLAICDIIQERKNYHKRQAIIIKNIAPKISESLNSLLKELEENRLKVVDEMGPSLKKIKIGSENSLAQTVEDIEDTMAQTVKDIEDTIAHIIELDKGIHKIITITYGSFVELLKFLENKKQTQIICNKVGNIFCMF